MSLSSTVRIASAALALAAFAVPRASEACGGTFCDNGPRAMPVDQTGENIVFVMDSGNVEAHIQIQYKGEAAKFSWLLPMPKVPEVEVGTQVFFDRLLQGTVPTYSFNTRFDNCNQSDSTSFTTSSTGSGSAVSTGGTGTGLGGGPPVVVYQKQVGAFDVAVLQSNSTADVIQWLTDNMYQVPPMAAQLLDAYTAKQYVFVAVKLTGGKGIDEIHPLVVRYPGTEPCVPLKLTAVAASENMGVRTFFLGNGRVVPKNFKHVVPNFAKFDWFNASTTYNDFVSSVVDSPIANGKAFVTEYAGPTAVVGASPIASPQWNAVPFVTAPAVTVIQTLIQQGLAQCVGGSCTFNHVLVLPLLREYLPPPATLMVNGNQLVEPSLIESVFYNCLTCFQSQIDQMKWNGPAFATAMTKRIIEPAKHADALLNLPYLTRMFTTISPAEMTEDPEFFERKDLPPVTMTSVSATLRVTCDNKPGMILPNGKNVALPSQSTWPRFPATMPFAERIEEFPASGDPVVLVDNNAAIDTELQTWNASQMWVPNTTTGGTTTNTGGQGGTNGAAVSSSDNGCGCRIGSSSAAAAVPWTLAALLGLASGLRRRGKKSS